MKRSSFSYVFLILTTIVFVLSLFYKTSRHDNNLSQTEIIPCSFFPKTDTLRVLLFFHACDYFIHKGIPIGFQYELFKELEKSLGIKMILTIESNFDLVFTEVFKNNYDIIALDFRKNEFIIPFLSLSYVHSYTYPVIVSCKKIVKEIPKGEIHIPAYYHYFVSLDPKYNNHFEFVYAQENRTEDLFEKLNEGVIDYLICDYNEAITLIPFYTDLTIVDKAGPKYERNWVLNKNNTSLNNQINHWLTEFQKSRKYKYLYKKYFSPRSTTINESFNKSNKYQISKYDELIKKYAKEYKIDWRFVASVICQESRFNSHLIGIGGSFGLMQLMPETMNFFDIDENVDIEAQIEAGVKYLDLIKNSFGSILDAEEQLYFIAAAYNSGRGHLFDAQRLCIKYGEDATVWSNVAKYLILKSQRIYASDSVVKSGFYPGKHTVNYANKVIERYKQYKVVYRDE